MLSSDSFGHIFKMTSFGESHGEAIGCVVEGCPSGVTWDESILHDFMQRRRPGQSKFVTARSEADKVKVLSGVFNGKTLGTPIAMVIENTNQKSQDYSKITDGQFRTGHADSVWSKKFTHVDLRGGGRSSGRETAARCMAGAVAKMFLNELSSELTVKSFLTKVASLEVSKTEKEQFLSSSKKPNDYFCSFISEAKKDDLRQALEKAIADGDSLGASVELVVQNMLPCLGEPVFAKLKSQLAQAFLSVGAVSSFEFGLGTQYADMTGVELHKNVKDYGGIQGGVSTGDDIHMKVAIKPTSSILDVAKKGRHDPCIAVRASVVLEAMTYLVLADFALWQRLNNL